ncbi:MAG: DEAD/DEAH box helicase [Desulfobacterales bacterium]|nr:DEAD/DEAH box helicase [Desulfobacterales bacterium]
MSFDQLGLRDELLKAIKTKGYTKPTAIQAKAIPVIIDGQDILARAQTGTGKTDAFGLSIVEILSRQRGKERQPRALVLTPTRELALQVGESIKEYARRVSLRCTVVYGGVRIDPQIDRLKRGIDILVATPGRLLDLVGHRHVKLSNLEFLVFDEADRMLDLGFSEEISEILYHIPAQRRTMLFSATYTRQIRNLAAKMLKDPKFIEVTPRTTAAESIVQKVHLVDQSNKRALLIHLITSGGWKRVLVFTRTRHGANKLTEKLVAQKLSAEVLHSSKSQSFRTRTLKSFKSDEIRVLVATDVAARGLDIINLPIVINYDTPSVPEDYVHRIGRTGRAGVSGIAVSLVSHNEKPYLRAIEKLLKQKIPVEKVDGFTADSVVPEYVLFRPDSAAIEKMTDKDIKDMVLKRDTSKEELKARKAKPKDSGKRSGSVSRPISGRKKKKTGNKTTKSGSRSSKASNRGKTRNRR